jgi:predicted metalloendopeptidase
LTQGENIADNGGLKTSFQAYKNSIGQSTPQLLPATASLTQDQLFFVAFGQTWCTIYSEQFITTNLKVNPHSPGPFRVNGAVSNNEQFAKAFNCPVGSPMNPRNKCNLW